MYNCIKVLSTFIRHWIHTNYLNPANTPPTKYN